jgi:hypothetical protein
MRRGSNSLTGIGTDWTREGKGVSSRALVPVSSRALVPSMIYSFEACPASTKLPLQSEPQTTCVRRPS